MLCFAIRADRALLVDFAEKDHRKFQNLDIRQAIYTGIHIAGLNLLLQSRVWKYKISAF